MSFDMKKYEEEMNKVISHLESELTKIRTGRANPKMLEGIMVEAYGTPTPIAQTAIITVPEAKQLLVKPFDPSQIEAIERGIMGADIGINPINDGENIRLNIPQLTEDTRKSLAKDVKTTGEEHKVRIRNVRQDANNAIKKNPDLNDDEKKGYEEDVQTLTNNFNKKIEETVKAKEEEVLTI